MAGALAQYSEAQQPVLDAQSAIASLLSKRANYMAGQDPAAQDQERKSALAQYQETLKANPAGSYTPNDHALATTVGNFAHMSPFAALASGAGAGGNFARQIEASRAQNNVTAAHAGYEDVLSQGKGDIQELGALKGLLSGSMRGMGKQPTPEQMRVVYGQAMTAASQAAKDYQFGSAEERMSWITQKANDSVQNYLQNFATQPLGPRGSDAAATPPSSPTPPPADAVQQPAADDENQRNVTLIMEELKRTPPGTDRYKVLQQELEHITTKSAQGLPSYLPEQSAQPQAPSAKPPIPPVPGTQPQAPGMRQPQLPSGMPPAPVAPLQRNIPNEKLQQSGNEKMAGVYAKDYEEATTKARGAEQQLAAFNMLEKIQPNTNVLANAQENIASVFSALGQDPGSPMIQNAVKNRQAGLILDQLRNAALRDENGVQTRTDEIRIANEFPKTTDFRQAWNFGIKLGKERALRSQERLQHYDTTSGSNNGVPVQARQKFDREYSNDPLTQYFGGKLIFRSDYLRGFMDLNPDASRSDAITSWRKKEADYQARGGRK